MTRQTHEWIGDDPSKEVKSTSTDVYLLVFPSGLFYFGTSSNAYKRWARNGEGYRGRGAISEEIEKTDWDFVKQDILIRVPTKEGALLIEQALILEYKSGKEGVGLNRQKIMKDFYKRISKDGQHQPTLEGKIRVRENFLKQYDLLGIDVSPYSQEKIQQIQEEKDKEAREKMLREEARWMLDNYTEALCNFKPLYKEPDFIEVYNEEYKEWKIRDEAQREKRRTWGRRINKNNMAATNRANQEYDTYMKERHRYDDFGSTRYYRP